VLVGPHAHVNVVIHHQFFQTEPWTKQYYLLKIFSISNKKYEEWSEILYLRRHSSPESIKLKFQRILWKRQGCFLNVWIDENMLGSYFQEVLMMNVNPAGFV
jgi:hypothetical protein